MIDRAGIDPAILPGGEERAMLRDSLQGFLAAHWPTDGAVARSADPQALAAVARGLADQGIGGLGRDPSEGGLREWTLVAKALGRAACAAPLFGGALANLALAGGGEPATVALLDGLADGTVRLAWSFGAHDPDPACGRIAWQGGGWRGTLCFVDGALAATHLAVAVGEANGSTPIDLALIDLAGPGVRLTPTRALGAEGWAEVSLDGAVATLLPMPADTVADLARIARLLHLSRAHGAARRAFELSIDHAKERRQFGQPIGRFQAIQHKLADNLIALEGTRLAIAAAAEAFDLGNADWRHAAAAAVAFGFPALREASLQTHHAFGAIGYAEEHEAPRHFRRVHLDALAVGGAAAAKRELAAQVLDGDGPSLPEYDLGPAGNALRAEVKDWLAAHWSGPRKGAFDALDFHDREFDPTFARDLGATGWIGLGWPREHGGQARTPLEQIAFMEAMENAEAPRYGASVQANALMMSGTPEQQASYLPEILRGEAMHGMGYSEPEAGSDLASLRTRAERDGDGWVITGQKIWTTTYWGRYMFLAARTDREAKPPHAGISMFFVPMDSPGITVKPATTMYDGRFANVFYDGVRVPAEALVGGVNEGWKVLTGALANERGQVGGGIVLKVAHAFDLLVRDLRADAARRDDPLVRDRVATLAAEIEIGRRLMIHCAELATGGSTPPELGAISKVFSGELMERFGEAALDLLGPRAALSQGAPGALRRGRYEQGLRHSLMWVISIGTNEIQRSLIAQRGLGLPR